MNVPSVAKPIPAKAAASSCPDLGCRPRSLPVPVRPGASLPWLLLPALLPALLPLLLMLLLMLALLASPIPARAEDSWTDPAPGVRHLHRSLSQPKLELHALVVDLGRPEVSLVATRPGEGMKTVPEFAEAYGAVAAINGNYFNYVSGAVFGLAMGEGVIWGLQHSTQRDYDVALGVSAADNQALIFDSPSNTEVPFDWISEAVAGKPWLLRAGQVEPLDCAAEGNRWLCEPNARTAVGLSQDRKTLLLVVVDWQPDGSAGLGCPGLAQVLLELGAFDAFSLSYSQSSTMFVAGEGGVVNCPGSSCQPIAVANHLGVRIDPDAAWYRAALAAQAPDPSAPLAPGATLERVVRYTNTGRLRWTAEGSTPMRLGTAEPRDRQSPFHDPASWVSPSRAARLNHEVAPGEDGSFAVLLRAPGGGGLYEEAFAPVVDGAEPVWLDGQPARWTVQVAGPQDWDGDGANEEQDCDDTDPRVHPDATELCNGRDDDCSGGVDDGIPAGRPARLVWSAVESGVLRLNGREVDRSTRWQEVRVVPVQLTPGANVVGVEAWRGSGRGGVLAVVWLPDGEQVPTNSSWEAATSAGEGWDRPGAPSEGFRRATVSDYFGQDPWSASLEGLPEELERSGLTWIWSSAPEEHDHVFLRRAWAEPEDCPVEGGVGVCSRGTWQCRSGRPACVAKVAPGELRETCNAKDDDCDGLTDELLAGCATADDAGPPPPDLGPSPPTATVFIPAPRQGGDSDSIDGAAGCNCRVGSGGAAAPPLAGSALLLGLLARLAAGRWRASAQGERGKPRSR